MLRKVMIQRTAFRNEMAARPVSTHVPRSARLNVRTDWLAVPIAEDELCVGLLRELRHAGSDHAPTLLVPSRFGDETCLSWYQTGNPYRMKELAAYFVRTASDMASLPLRHLGLVDELAADLAVDHLAWPPFAPGMLPDAFMPQQRWVTGSLKEIQGWLAIYEATGRRTVIGRRFAEPGGAKKHVVYLTEAVGTDWVKFGKAAEETALIRLRQAQLCAPYRLRHLGVWDAPGGDAAQAERTLERALKQVARDKRGSGCGSSSAPL